MGGRNVPSRQQLRSDSQAARLSCAVRCVAICFSFALLLLGCDELSQPRKEQPRAEQAPAGPARQGTASNASNEGTRFVLPAKSSPFPEAGVALDTTTGKLCKTYAWEDNPRLPKGLPLCSELTGLVHPLTGATKAYRGFTYTFNGTRWVKGSTASRYNDKTGNMEPWSDDQYDPLNLFSKEEKAKTTLTVEQIRKVAEQFGVTFEEARDEAKQQGYQVPPPLSSFEKKRQP